MESGRGLRYEKERGGVGRQRGMGNELSGKGGKGPVEVCKLEGEKREMGVKDCLGWV